MRSSVAGAVPSIAIAMQRVVCRDTFFRDDLLQRVKPVRIISLAGVGIAGALRALDFGRKRRCPFATKAGGSIFARVAVASGWYWPDET